MFFLEPKMSLLEKKIRQRLWFRYLLYFCWVKMSENNFNNVIQPILKIFLRNNLITTFKRLRIINSNHDQFKHPSFNNTNNTQLAKLNMHQMSLYVQRFFKINCPNFIAIYYISQIMQGDHLIPILYSILQFISHIKHVQQLSDGIRFGN